jgi:DNA-binding CsgD family transcriptional regulator
MSEKRDQSEFLVDAIYDGIVETPGWQIFLDGCCTLFGAEAGSILIESNSLGYPERLRLFSSNAAPALSDRIDVFSSESIFGASHSEDAVLMTVPGPGDAISGLGFSAAIEPGIAFAFGLWRGEVFDQPDTARCRALIPHLKRAMRIFVQYAQAFRERAVYQTVIDRIGIGVALVDAKSTIMATNAIGREILAAGDGLKIANGRLTAGNSDLARALENYVRAAAEAQTQPAHEHGKPLAVERDHNPSALTVIVHPGPPAKPMNTPLRRSAIVVMRDPDRRASVSAHVVGQLFGLTPAEATLATLLAQGADLDEAAAELGIRRNTARSQLQSIFMKTNAKRQSELVRMILSSVATLSH